MKYILFMIAPYIIDMLQPVVGDMSGQGRNLKSASSFRFIEQVVFISQ